MKTTENRRKRLKAWFEGGPLPERERSYLSQLINGQSSFGEKAARRIEKDYKMPDGYLDFDEASSSGLPPQKSITLDDSEERLVSLFRTFPDAAKKEMLELFAEKSKEFERLFDELMKIRNSTK